MSRCFIWFSLKYWNWPTKQTYKSKHLEHQSWQTQISNLSDTLGTLSYNRAICKSNLAKYLIRAEQPFSFAEDETFTKFIRNTHNPEYDPFCKDTIKTKMFRIVEERKQLLLAIFSSMPQRVALTSDCWEALNGFHFIVSTTKNYWF